MIPVTVSHSGTGFLGPQLVLKALLFKTNQTNKVLESANVCNRLQAKEHVRRQVTLAELHSHPDLGDLCPAQPPERGASASRSAFLEERTHESSSSPPALLIPPRASYSSPAPVSPFPMNAPVDTIICDCGASTVAMNGLVNWFSQLFPA